MVWTYEGPVLFWTAPKAKDEMDKAVQYVVYRFDKKEKVNLDDASHIVAITRDHFYPLPYNDGKTKYQYVVTALDRLHNESKVLKESKTVRSGSVSLILDFIFTATAWVLYSRPIDE